MTSLILKKFNKFIFYPDLSNKFLLTSYYSIVPPNKFQVYLKYIFNDRSIYNSIALKALLMLSSIFPKRCLGNSRIILVKFAKNRCISSVYHKITLSDLIPLISYTITKPINTNITLNGFIKESKHFIFPGFIKRLKFPSWDRFVSLSFHQISNKYLYFFLFYKTAYID
jgi:hypothetical protein